MTRIIAGEWRSHPLPRLKTGTVRPTTDRARTILFDTLREVRNMDVLDLYSGTGALGFEALSRGAASLVSIDRDAKYIRAQKLWIQDRDKVYRAHIGEVMGVLKKIDGQFDLIFADPPYADGLSDEVLRLIEDHSRVGTLFVHESARRDASELDSKIFDLWKEKVVAETKIQIYKAH